MKNKIRVELNGYGLAIPRTEVYVNGSFAYQSGNHPKIETEHLQKIFSLIKFDEDINIEIINMSLGD